MIPESLPFQAMLICTESHRLTLLGHLNDLRKEGTFCDFSIIFRPPPHLQNGQTSNHESHNHHNNHLHPHESSSAFHVNNNPSAFHPSFQPQVNNNHAESNGVLDHITQQLNSSNNQSLPQHSQSTSGDTDKTKSFRLHKSVLSAFMSSNKEILRRDSYDAEPDSYENWLILVELMYMGKVKISNRDSQVLKDIESLASSHGLDKLKIRADIDYEVLNAFADDDEDVEDVEAYESNGHNGLFGMNGVDDDGEDPALLSVKAELNLDEDDDEETSSFHRLNGVESEGIKSEETSEEKETSRPQRSLANKEPRDENEEPKTNQEIQPKKPRRRPQPPFYIPERGSLLGDRHLEDVTDLTGLKAAMISIRQVRVPDAADKHPLQQTTKERRVMCPMCPERPLFRQRMEFVAHFTEAHPEVPDPGNLWPAVRCNTNLRRPECKTIFKCTVCASASYRTKNKLIDHVQREHPDADLKKVLDAQTGLACKYCGKTYFHAIAYEDHMRDHETPTPSYPCNQCPKKFTTLLKLKSHLTFHRMTYSHVCEICSHVLNSKAMLKHHIKAKHTMERNFPCDYCGVAFINKGTLNKHIKNIHTKERPFVCDTCGYAFVNQCRLREHTARVHEGRRDHMCIKCGKAFGGKGNLRRHMKMTCSK